MEGEFGVGLLHLADAQLLPQPGFPHRDLLEFAGQLASERGLRTTVGDRGDQFEPLVFTLQFASLALRQQGLGGELRVGGLTLQVGQPR